ncbi:extracellular solute-binding protein [Paenibacillus spongiae]|uniref:Extracellular solute-binding protein n=1 Tax=Paenibacillus spongiae TaxID=2909671 RepID=A0ABY5S264_9BACL|nr:extracellular solute-binding protein [Paenibacillus spongiae]UVI27533.1 extracellular solute-binding protein [Paenibacillus spongiae]
MRTLWLGKRAYAAAVLVLVLVISACSGGGGSTSSESKGANAPVTSDNKPDDGNKASEGNAAEGSGPVIELTVWDAPKPEDPQKALTEELFSEFEKANPNIKVTHELMPQGTNDREVFVTAMAGGNGPDAYSAAHFPIIGDWVGQGLALDLTPYWESYADKDQFIESSLQAGTIDGKVYGLPNDMYVTGLLWNKKLFEEAGLDRNTPPANWDEVVSFGKKLTKEDKKQYALTLLGMEWADWWFEYYVWQAGGDLTELNADGTVKLTFTSDATVKALQYYKDLKWTHKIVQNNVLQSYQDNMNDLFQGRAAMTNGASGGFGEYAANGLDLNDLGFAPYPVGPSGKGPSQIGGAYWIINPKSSKEKQDAAWKYVTYMMSKEVREKYYQFQMDNGIFPNLLSVRKDVDPGKYTTNVPQDLIDGVTKAAADSRLEYYLKERLTPYVVKAVQQALTDEKSDVMTLLQKAQEAAQKEVVDAYNASLK